jgi:hypothetical protein
MKRLDRRLSHDPDAPIDKSGSGAASTEVV